VLLKSIPTTFKKAQTREKVIEGNGICGEGLARDKRREVKV
jgi:hypothetical protein